MNPIGTEDKIRNFLEMMGHSTLPIHRRDDVHEVKCHEPPAPELVSKTKLNPKLNSPRENFADRYHG